MIIQDAVFFGSVVIFFLFGMYLGFKSGFNYGSALGKAKEFLHFTLAIQNSFPDKTQLEDVLDRVGKEYNILSKPKIEESK